MCSLPEEIMPYRDRECNGDVTPIVLRLTVSKRERPCTPVRMSLHWNMIRTKNAGPNVCSMRAPHWLTEAGHFAPIRIAYGLADRARSPLPRVVGLHGKLCSLFIRVNRDPHDYAPRNIARVEGLVALLLERQRLRFDDGCGH